MNTARLLCFSLAFAAATSGAAIADDWSADKLRGQVLQLVSDQWQPLHRGDVVSDSRVIRTLGSGHVTFVRGAETVELGPDTQIQIHDEHADKPFTTVQQYFGEVSVEAEVENVEHFAVQTPYLAAVVKGTRFVVTSGKGGATVQVNRGHVAVSDYRTRDHVTVSVNQSAAVTVSGSGKTELTVAGSGTLPVVLNAQNQPVETATESVASDQTAASQAAAGAAAPAEPTTGTAVAAPVTTPVGPTAVTPAGKPVPGAKPIKDDKPAKDPKPVKDEKPAKAEPPKPPQPAKDAKPPKADPPAKADKPAKPAKPAKGKN